MENNERRVDLHLHTLHSDGTFSPEELIERASELGLSAISITDHDTVRALQPARRLAGSLEVISGVELTVRFRNRELHVLGYGFREDDPDFDAFLEEKREMRKGRIREMIEQLQARGVSVTIEEVEQVVGLGESVGRPHLAEVLVRRGVVPSLDEAFKRYLGDQAPCFVQKATLSVSEAVHWIRKTGGVAVLAHPYRLVDDAWIPELVAEGIQGIEAYHSDHSPEVVDHYRRMAQERHLLITGGSDCHGMRKARGPLIGSVTVPYSCLERLKAAIKAQA